MSQAFYSSVLFTKKQSTQLVTAGHFYSNGFIRIFTCSRQNPSGDDKYQETNQRDNFAMSNNMNPIELLLLYHN